MTKDAKLFKSFPEDEIQMSEVPGPGEQNFWGSSSKDGALWISRKGQTVLAVVLAGQIKQHESLREPLRDLVASGLRRLP
jgi:hypothetical protein